MGKVGNPNFDWRHITVRDTDPTIIDGMIIEEGPFGVGNGKSIKTNQRGLKLCSLAA